MYCDRILDLFGEGRGAPTRLYNRQAFEKWWKGYCAEQEEDVGWQAVRSPYEM